MNVNDRDLYNKIKKGNEPAYDALFRKYYAPLCRFALMFTKDENNAEEVAQQFFIKLWNDRGKIKITSSVKSYLYTSIRNASLNFLQKEKTRDLYEDSYEDNKVQENGMTINDDFNLIYEEAVEKLPDRTKEVFILSKNEGLTYGEIAEYLQISAKTVENNMGIAFRKLREFLMPYKNLIYQ